MYQPERELVAAAKRGDAKAQYQLGYEYESYEPGTIGMRLAATWYRRSAMQGNVQAQVKIAGLRRCGAGVRQDMQLAVDWYRLAAEHGNAEAQRCMGFHYSQGYGVGKNRRLAEYWYRRMVATLRIEAEQGDVNAQRQLGDCYAEGKGVEKDMNLAVVWYQKAAATKPASYCGRSCLDKCKKLAAPAKPATLVAEETRRAAEQGDAESQLDLGRYYLRGKGVVKDKRMAAIWFQKAFDCFRQRAEHGDPEAQNRIGDCYQGGYGVAKNEKLAVRWYRRAAKQGYWLAQLNLSSCYAKGRGVAKNRRLDEFWYGRMLKSTQSF